MAANSLRVGVVMDPIESITPKKDSSLAMLLEAERRGAEIHYFNQADIRLFGGDAYGSSRILGVRDDPEDWFSLGGRQDVRLGDLDVILMRKDPPFDMEYIYSTYILERAEDEGAMLVNRPRSLRDMNEKAYIAWFAECAPPTLVTRSIVTLKEFLAEYQHVVLKPLGAMGGKSIFAVRAGDANANVIIETLTDDGKRYAMAQQYVPEITRGDKRILLVGGEPVPYALARIPAGDDFRGNLVMGAVGKGVELSQRDRWICEQVGPVLAERGVLFAGIDVIGDYLTEINVTSPTGIRELDKAFGLNIAGTLFDLIEARLG